MRKQRGQSAVEFALMAPLVLFMVLAAIYGGAMFIQFMNYNNEARRIARDIAVAPESERKTLMLKYNSHGNYFNFDGETLLGMYAVKLTTELLMNVEKKDEAGNTIEENGKPVTELKPITNESDYSNAEEVHVRFDFDLNGRQFPFGFPPEHFAASYHMQLEDN